MSPAQEAAFAAASGGQSSSALLTAIASIVMVLALTWLAWLALRLFERWTARRTDIAGLLWHLIRAAIVLSVIGWYVR
jgi:integrating conjugative element protein (TIGR03758 family)